MVNPYPGAQVASAPATRWWVRPAVAAVAWVVVCVAAMGWFASTLPKDQPWREDVFGVAAGYFAVIGAMAVFLVMGPRGWLGWTMHIDWSEIGRTGFPAVALVDAADPVARKQAADAGRPWPADFPVIRKVGQMMGLSFVVLTIVVSIQMQMMIPKAKPQPSAQLRAIANDFNAKCPITADQFTRVDKVIPGYNELDFQDTLLNISDSDVVRNQKEISDAVTRKLLESPYAKQLKGITVIYSFHNPGGHLLVRVSVQL